MAIPLTSVPGQRLVGKIDGLFRNSPGDGTLGLPDYSLVPYQYLPMLEPAGGGTTWVIDHNHSASYGAFKGSPDGLGAFRDVSAGGSANAYAVDVIPQVTGSKQTGTPRTPDIAWGPKDFAFALRHSGASTWDGATRAYLAFDSTANTVGMQLTTPAAAGPWDSEIADSAAIPFTGSRPQIWNGQAHNVIASTIGQNVLCIIDGAFAVPFRLPRAYHRNSNGTINTGVFADLPSTGKYGAFDCRGTSTWLYGWTALDSASGDFFYYDMGALTTQVAPTTSYTPSALPSGEAWTLTGTVTASKNGLLLNASSSAFFNVRNPYGYICTKWGAVATGGGVVFRRQDASNYLLLTSTALVKVVAGVSTTLFTFTLGPWGVDADVVIHNEPSRVTVCVQGVVQNSALSVASFSTATGIGFISPSGGTSQFRYVAFQPQPNTAVVPTT